MPDDIEGTFTKIQEALTDGVLTEERIDHSLKKILKAKYWAGLYENTAISQENLLSDLNTVYDDV